MSIIQDKTFLEVINEMFADGRLGSRLDEESFFLEIPNGHTGSNQARIETHKNYNGSGASAL